MIQESRFLSWGCDIMSLRVICNSLETGTGYHLSRFDPLCISRRVKTMNLKFLRDRETYR